MDGGAWQATVHGVAESEGGSPLPSAPTWKPQLRRSRKRCLGRRHLAPRRWEGPGHTHLAVGGGGPQAASSCSHALGEAPEWVVSLEERGGR